MWVVFRVVGDLADLEQRNIREDPLLDGAVVHERPAGVALDKTLRGPQVVGHAISRSARFRKRSGTK